MNGKLYVVGIGPGGEEELTPRARAAIAASEVVAGYPLYLEQVAALLGGKTTVATGMTGETERCRAALEHARDGRVVSVVSGGDAGVYGMAGLVLELAGEGAPVAVEVIPGVTAATAAAALLGAPLGHDFAVVSLSDRLTDWAQIERRLRAAAQGDYILCLYNPASKGRPNTLRRACAVLLEQLDPATPCGIARNVGREGESARIVPLEGLMDMEVDMRCTVIVGNRATRVVDGRLLTPRGYRL